jgi:hypothetical protein
MDYKQILATHIQNKNKREKFLEGCKDNYTITNLDLRKVEEYNFKDGNIYLFENCILKDLNIYFKNDTIVFENCIFGGNIYIHNTGIGEDDVINIKDIIPDGPLYNIIIKSPEVILDNNKITCANILSITTDICDIDTSVLNAPIIKICVNSDCHIKNSVIDHAQLSYQNLNIENSNINDQNINYFKSESEKGYSKTK